MGQGCVKAVSAANYRAFVIHEESTQVSERGLIIVGELQDGRQGQRLLGPARIVIPATKESTFTDFTEVTKLMRAAWNAKVKPENGAKPATEAELKEKREAVRKAALDATQAMIRLEEREAQRAADLRRERERAEKARADRAVELAARLSRGNAVAEEMENVRLPVHEDREEENEAKLAADAEATRQQQREADRKALIDALHAEKSAADDLAKAEAQGEPDEMVPADCKLADSDRLHVVVRHKIATGEIVSDVLAPGEWIDVAKRLRLAAARNRIEFGYGDNTSLADLLSNDKATANVAAAKLTKTKPSVADKIKSSSVKLIARARSNQKIALDAIVADAKSVDAPGPDVKIDDKHLENLKARLRAEGVDYTARKPPDAEDNQDSQFNAIKDQMEHRDVKPIDARPVVALRKRASDWLKDNAAYQPPGNKTLDQLTLKAKKPNYFTDHSANSRGEFISLIALADSLKVRIVVFSSDVKYDCLFEPTGADDKTPTLFLGYLPVWHWVSLRNPTS